MNNKYNIGDFIYIAQVPKWGVIYGIDNSTTCSYLIYWVYPDGSSESVKVRQSSLSIWVNEEGQTRFGNKILTNKND
jgi:hypothetical protein